MKILVVSNMYPDEKHPSYGVFVKNFCDQLEKLNIQHSLSVMKKADSKLQKLVGYVIFYLETFLKSLFGRYDLIYIHYASHSSAPVLLASKIRKNRIYTNVHGSDVVPENRDQEKMQKYTRSILNVSEKIIVPSEYFKNYVAKKYTLDPHRIHIVYSGGVNKQMFYSDNEKRQNERLKIGYVGRLSFGKGWDTLLEACAKITDIDYELILVGNGPEEEIMNQMIQELKLQKHITRYNLLSQEELNAIYNEIDVFAFPTEREGESLGLVAVEAMACGTPVIASDFAAPADYVHDGENGYKFVVGDAENLANAIRQFYHLSAEERNKMKDNAKRTAEEYSVENVLNQMKMVFEE